MGGDVFRLCDVHRQTVKEGKMLAINLNAVGKFPLVLLDSIEISDSEEDEKKPALKRKREAENEAANEKKQMMKECFVCGDEVLLLPL